MPLLPDIKGMAQGLLALKRFVLLIGDAGAVAARLSGNNVEAYQFLSGAIEENINQAKLFLSEHPKYPLVVLFDVLGQAYRRDRLPPVNLLDRQKILTRKLETLFPGSELKGGLRLGASEGDIRGFDYLFAAVTPAPDITAWRELLEQIDNPISDVRLLPVESVKLLQLLAGAASNGDNGSNPWKILISQHRTGGFRQIVTRDHRLVIARMTSGFINIDAPDEIAGLLQREIGATIDYITRLGFDRAMGLDAYFIGRSDISAALDRAQLPVRRLQAFTPAEAETRMGVTGARDDSGHFADLLHAAWGGSRVLPGLSIWPWKKRQQRMLDLTQIWGARALAAASVLGMIYGAELAWQIQDAELEYSQAEAARAGLEQQYDAHVSKLDSGVVPIARIRDIIAIHTQLEAGNVDLNRLYSVISGILSADARLRSIVVQASPPALVLAASPEEGGLPPSGAGAAPLTGKIILSLDLSSFRHAELAVRETDRLAGALRAAFPDMAVTIVRQPLYILPTDTLTVKPGENVLAFTGEDKFARIELDGRLQ